MPLVGDSRLTRTIAFDGGGNSNNSNSETSQNSSHIKHYYPTQNNWESGSSTIDIASGEGPDTLDVNTKIISTSAFVESEAIKYEQIDSASLTDEELKRLSMPDEVSRDDNPIGATSRSAWANTKKRKEMLDEDKTLIQNNYSFPYYIRPSQSNLTAKYDYQIIAGDPRYPAMVKLEDKLKEARASFGLHVHGNNDIARAVKYNLYNRFKVPDTNQVFSKMTTHVFFTRPDLNLLNCHGGKAYGPNYQIKNHSDTSLLYRMNPYIFRLLTDSDRCGDSNNFNMLLSNNVGSFDIIDEELNATEVGKTYGGNSIFYGGDFTGRRAGEFSCRFEETQDLSIIKLMKLWVTYIDNVSKGAWSPSYDLHGMAVEASSGFYNPDNQKYQYSKAISGSHVYTKTLDYAASVYVLKCGPSGSDVQYWTKYYGVFPVVTGSSALSWDGGAIGGQIPAVTIRFKYGYKKDLSLISLVEFNEISGIGDTNMAKLSEASFNPAYNHSSRPFVGAPFVEISLPDGSTGDIGNNADMYGRPTANIQLKFLKNVDSNLSDDLLYRNNTTSKSTTYIMNKNGNK